jgi:hypothetical protein
MPTCRSNRFRNAPVPEEVRAVRSLVLAQDTYAAILGALAVKANRVQRQVDVREVEVRHLGQPGAGVVQQPEDAVTLPLGVL